RIRLHHRSNHQPERRLAHVFIKSWRPSGGLRLPATASRSLIPWCLFCPVNPAIIERTADDRETGIDHLLMPIYEDICDDCKAQLEKIVINRQEEISCPACSSKNATIQLSVFASTGGSGSSKFSAGGSGSGGACCGGGCGCH